MDECQFDVVSNGTVACRPVAGKRPGNKQLCNNRCYVMALQTTTVARQWQSRDHLGSPTDTKATIAQQQRKGVFCAVRAEMV
jgi:hypothetical protein